MYAAVVIDSLKFARERGQLSGKVQVAAMARLNDILYDNRGDLVYRIQGGSDTQGRPILELKITGIVHLQCQRCLKSLEHAVDCDTALRLIAGSAEQVDREQDDDPDTPDCIEANTELNVDELIEDELVLALPVHPRHLSDVCRSKPVVADGQQRRETPAFGGLAALLKISEKSTKE